jgi:hypothetical protein
MPSAAMIAFELRMGNASILWTSGRILDRGIPPQDEVAQTCFALNRMRATRYSLQFRRRGMDV